MRVSAKRRLKPVMKHEKHENFSDRTHHLCKSDHILVSFRESGHVRNSNVHPTITMSVTWCFSANSMLPWESKIVHISETGDVSVSFQSGPRRTFAPHELGCAVSPKL